MVLKSRIWNESSGVAKNVQQVHFSEVFSIANARFCELSQSKSSLIAVVSKFKILACQLFDFLLFLQVLSNSHQGREGDFLSWLVEILDLQLSVGAFDHKYYFSVVYIQNQP